MEWYINNFFEQKALKGHFDIKEWKFIIKKKQPELQHLQYLHDFKFFLLNPKKDE